MWKSSQLAKPVVESTAQGNKNTQFDFRWIFFTSSLLLPPQGLQARSPSWWFLPVGTKPSYCQVLIWQMAPFASWNTLLSSHLTLTADRVSLCNQVTSNRQSLCLTSQVLRHHIPLHFSSLAICLWTFSKHGKVPQDSIISYNLFLYLFPKKYALHRLYHLHTKNSQTSTSSPKLFPGLQTQGSNSYRCLTYLDELLTL